MQTKINERREGFGSDDRGGKGVLPQYFFFFLISMHKNITSLQSMPTN